MKNNIKLQSGMMLLTKYGDTLHYLMGTPLGLKAIDSCGSCIEFNQEFYTSAYFPVDYDNKMWDKVEGTEIIF